MFPPRSRVPEGDAAIRATDNDAALARLSAVRKGYLTDPFITPLVPRAHLEPLRPPLINIGTYVRSEALDELVNGWLALSQQEGVKCQIVSLGAGSDTRFWRIATGPNQDTLARYIEIDFPEITTKKAMAIRKSKDLSSLLGKPEDVHLGNGGTALHSPVYSLLAADLRRPPAESLAPLLTAGPEPPLAPHLPTLLIFECVLVYMTPEASGAILQWFTDYFQNNQPSRDGRGVLGSIVYEMFALGDQFGKVMVNNLKARNVTLPGAEPYPTFESLPTRFLQHGWDVARALTLKDIRRDYIDPSELERISQLEMLDEIEELELVLAHYAITWGVKLPPATGELKARWQDWGLMRKRA
ncbi:leucine carboxyl methyltransferase [Trametes coccinea BRFM310]|uniref:Leucine carboxyl methyltransferase 1 n=1 Tax=Trametes coccinea (strain BRFM310) TaxID=1353009 RepID=A0A1Y2IGM1_TRAC3|nr:leucine carboxyl methyltransferase [Trametes coccinea BRFM310]